MIKNIEFVGLRILEDDIKKVRVKNDTDVNLYEKGWSYISGGLENCNYKYLCQGFKCLRLIEKNYPNSKYIFKFYSRARQCNKTLTKYIQKKWNAM